MAIAAGCGARTPLDDASSGARGRGGAGGGASTASVASSSSAGEGGGLVFTASSSSSTGGGVVAMACPAGKLGSPVVTVSDAGTSDQPSIVAVDGSGGTDTAIVYTRVTSSDSTPHPRLATLAAWSAWPPPLVGSALEKGSAKKKVACTSLATGRDLDGHDTFKLACSDAAGKSSRLWTARSNGTISGEDVGSTHAGQELLISPSPSIAGMLFGVGAPATGFALDLSMSAGADGENFFEETCATTPVAADAVAEPGGWLLTIAGGTIPEVTSHDVGCALDDPEAGPATLLWFGTATHTSTKLLAFEEIDMITTSAPVTRIKMAEHDGGAWAAWSVSGEAVVHGALIAGGVLQAPFSLDASVGELAPEDFGLVTLGTGALFALVERGETDDTIALVEVDASGNMLWSASIDAGGAVAGPISLLASPTLDAALVAWPELLSGTSKHVIRVARVDCIPGP